MFSKEKGEMSTEFSIFKNPEKSVFHSNITSLNQRNLCIAIRSHKKCLGCYFKQNL